MNISRSMSFKAAVGMLLVLVTISIVAAYGTTNPIVFGHSAGELDFTGFVGNITTGGNVVANAVCIGTECRTSWPTINASTVTFLNVTNSIITNLFNATNLFSTNVTSNFLTTNILNTTNLFSTNLTTTFLTTNFLNTTNLFSMTLNASNISADMVCIAGDCRTVWPSFTAITSNGSVFITNFTSLSLTNLTNNNFVINGTVVINNGTLVLNNTSGTVIVLNNTFFNTLNNTLFVVTNNSFFTTTNTTFVINNTIFTPNPINLTNIVGNVVASGDVQGNRLCIGTDCRTSWPTVSGSSSGGPSVIFQAQTFVDEDTNYFVDLNTGANIAGTWILNGQLQTNSVCIGGDCRTSWPSSSSSSGATIIHTSVSAVSSVSQKSIANDGVAQWMITGGHRFCTNQGYVTGTVVEYVSENPSSNVDVACFN